MLKTVEQWYKSDTAQMFETVEQSTESSKYRWSGATEWGLGAGAGANKPVKVAQQFFCTLRLRPVAVAAAAGCGPQPIRLNKL